MFNFSRVFSQTRVQRMFAFSAIFPQTRVQRMFAFPAIFPQTRVVRMFDFSHHFFTNEKEEGCHVHWKLLLLIRH
jgi:hypothetical protein